MNKIFSILKQLALSTIKIFRKRIIIPIRMNNDSLQKSNIEYNQQRFYGPQKYFVTPHLEVYLLVIMGKSLLVMLVK